MRERIEKKIGMTIEEYIARREDFLRICEEDDDVEIDWDDPMSLLDREERTYLFSCLK